MLGWREWVALPELGIHAVHAKVDTGARTSSLQAFDVMPYDGDQHRRIRFRVLPHEDDVDGALQCDAELVEERWIKDSGGHATLRPVIRTLLHIGGVHFPIELSLATRPDLAFRMLLGRGALRGRFVVDPWADHMAGTGVTADFGVSD